MPITIIVSIRFAKLGNWLMRKVARMKMGFQELHNPRLKDSVAKTQKDQVGNDGRVL